MSGGIKGSGAGRQYKKRLDLDIISVTNEKASTNSYAYTSDSRMSARRTMRDMPKQRQEP